MTKPMGFRFRVRVRGLVLGPGPSGPLGGGPRPKEFEV